MQIICFYIKYKTLINVQLHFEATKTIKVIRMKD